MLALQLERSRCRESLVSALASMGAPGCVTATGFELTPSEAPGANDRVVRGDDALVFVDPPASAAPADALLDARIQAGRGPLRLPPSKLRPARGASSRPAGDTSGEHLPLARTRPPAPASLRAALLRQRGPLPVAYKPMRTRWIREAGGEAESTRPRARRTKVDRRAERRLDLAAGRAASARARRPLRGVLCEVVDVERPQRFAQLAFPRIA